MKIAKLLILLLSVCAGYNAFPDESAELPEYAKRYDPKRDPFSDLAMASQVAKEEGRLVLLIVGGSWCSWCHVLDRYFARDDEFRAAFYETFEIVKIYYGRKNKNKNFLSKFPKIIGVPHFFILDGKFRILGSQETGALERKRPFSTSPERYSKKYMSIFLEYWREYLQNLPHDPANPIAGGKAD